MQHPFLTLRASATAFLVLWASATLAASPATPEETLAALQSEFALSVKPGEQADLHRELLATVLRRVQRSYATDVEVAKLAAAASQELALLPAGTGEPAQVFKKVVDKVLQSLDPYSRYLDAQAHLHERSDSSGSFGGLGLEVDGSDGAVRVVAPMPDSPAARAGLRAGDLIVRVDDQPLLGVALSEAISRMRGRPGTPVSVTIRRPGLDQEFTVALTRDTIRRQVLRWSMEGEVLVLRLGAFTASVSASLQQAVAQASVERIPQAVVLDLRGNPGGLLREAVLIADAFLSQGEIVSLRGRTPGNQRTWRADPAEILAGVPMVVLIDRRSASAAELLATALQENGRATVMGQRSFGKGTVQSVFWLGEQQGTLRLTTAFYHGPAGRSVQRVGVAPDIALLAAPQAEATLDRDHPLQASTNPDFRQARVEQDRCSFLQASDPVLSCALVFLRAGDVEAFLAASAPLMP